MPVRRRSTREIADRSEVRAAVREFLVLGLAALVVVAVPSALLMRHLTRAHTLEQLGESVERMAESMVVPLVDPAMLRGDPDALAALDTVATARVADGSVEQITLWRPSGLVVYSTDTAIIGEEFPLHDWDERVLDGDEPVATFEDTGVPLHDYEPPHGRFVEVDLAMEAAGEDLVLEVYYPAQVVHQQQSDLLVTLLPVGLATLVALQLAQLPPAIRLAGSVQRLQGMRGRLMTQAAAASDLERRRIARDLHDDVIQELVGVSYALESVGSRDEGAADVIGRARALVRKSVADLRGMMMEIYPADLDAVGLSGALEEHATRLRDAGIAVELDVPDDVAMEPSRATLLYRLAREVMTNALKHSGAGTVQVTLVLRGGRAGLTIRDDGRGFDTSEAAREGHLGLRLVRDVVAEVGGTLEVTSGAGRGTTVIAWVPLD